MIYIKLLISLLIHKWYVFLAGTKLKVPIWQLLIHDWTKFGFAEFSKHARYKYLDGYRKEWSEGWLHHLHYNAHHPEHWILLWHGDPEFYSGIGQRITDYVTLLPMPEVFVREMLADMHATSKQITGNWDIASWFNEYGPRFFFHEDTVIIINKVMMEIGYTSDDGNWSWVANSDFRMI